MKILTTTSLKTLTYLAFACLGSLLFTACDGDDDDGASVTTPADISGTYEQEDIMGRPGITTVFGGTDQRKNMFNASIPTNRQSFQQPFQDLLEAYHDVYGNALGATIDYEENILGLDAATFTTVLAQFDALQVAPTGATVYYDPATDLALTGRRLQDDVVDVSLTLMFGGMSGSRFDGNGGTPQLTSDGVGLGDRNFSNSFPYLEPALQ